MFGTTRRATAALVAMGALILTAEASAAQRFAAPGGLTSGTCLTPATACLLDHVTRPEPFGPLAAGDEIIVAPGTYTDADLSPFGLRITRAVTMRGQDGAPPPTLRLSSGEPGATVETKENVTLRHLRIERTGSDAPVVLHDRSDTALTAEAITVVTDGAPTAGIAVGGGLTLRNAFVSVATTGASPISGVNVVAAASPATVRIVNSTVRASGANATAIALGGDFAAGGVLTGSILNTVTQAPTELQLSAGGGGSAAVTARNSNFRAPSVGAGTTLTDGGGNQTADPLLDAAGVPQPGSPLINAGVAEPDIGQTDLAGNARSQGPAPDIGAFEAPGITQGGSGAGTPPAAAAPPAGVGTAPAPGALLRVRLLTLPKTVRRSVLRKGFAVQVTVTGPATVVAELTGPKRKRLARTRVVARTSGRVTVRLKARVAGRQRVAATLKVTATPAGGRSATVSRKLTVR